MAFSSIWHRPVDKIEQGIKKISQTSSYQQFLDWYESLAPDTRVQAKIALGASALLLALAIALIPVWNSFSRYAELRQIQNAVTTLQEGSKKVKSLRRQMSQSATTQPLNNRSAADAAIGTIARQAGIPAGLIKVSPPRQNEVSESLNEWVIPVTIGDIPLDYLTKFINAVKTSPNSLSISQMSIKQDNDLSGYLNVSMTLKQLEVTTK